MNSRATAAGFRLSTESNITSCPESEIQTTRNGRTSPNAPASPAAPISVKAEFDLAEAQFTSAIAGLESIARSEQSALDMETADVLQVNLTVIDGAINESRAALQTEPDNPTAQESVFEALRSKL